MKKITLFLFFISIFLSFFLNIEKINVPYFNGIYKNVSIDLTVKNNLKSDVFYNTQLKTDVLKIDDGHYLIKHKNHPKIKKLQLKNTENIEKIIVYNGSNIDFPEIKNEININNSKDIFTNFSIFILSLFYNPQVYILSYILLFIYFIKYGFKFNYKIYIPLLFVLTFILRISSLNAIPFWDDEIYSLVIIDNPSFLSVFNDPGNPPLYFIFLKLFKIIFNNESFLRLSSVILGVLFNFVFYLWLKKTISKKVAVIGLFLCTVNIILVYYSQELRSYMLLMILSCLNALFLFNFKKKNGLYYFLSSAALLYTHFYGAFLFLYNFIFGLFYLSKKRLKSFILINLTAFMLFIPVLFYKKESITSNFNSWMNIPGKSSYYLVFETFSGKVSLFFIFVFACIFLYFFLKKRKYKTFLAYNALSILFIFISSITFTYLVKPVFFYKYFYVVYPMYLALISFFAGYRFRIKYGFILSFAILMIFGLNSRLNRQNLFCNHDLYLKFVKHDIDISKNNYIFMSDTVIGYKKFENMFKDTKATIKYLPINQGIYDTNPLKEDTIRPFVAYVSNLYLQKDAIDNANKIELYKSPVGVFLKAEYK